MLTRAKRADTTAQTSGSALRQVFSVLAVVALVAGLVLSTPFPEVANVTALVLMSIGLVTLAFDKEARAMAKRPSFLMAYGAFSALLLALLPTARGVEDIAAIMILAPLWLAGPYAALIARAPKGLLEPSALGVLALLGTVGAVAVTGYDVFILQMPRGGFSVNNPIHLADLAVSLGFFALVGLFGRHRWRFVVLLGPLFALAAVLLSGSRGPLLAFCVLAIVAAGYFVVVSWKPSRTIIAAVVVVLACLALAMPFVTFNLGGREFQLAQSVGSIMAGDSTDSSNNERFAMLRTAWGAFQASPIFGHGLINYTSKAAVFSPADNPYIIGEHLHNDIANFSVIGGMLGVLCYAMLILAPLVGAAKADGAQRNMVLFIALMASSGYVAMGLTNAMLGILTQTVLYGLMLALIGILSRRSPS